MEYIIPAALEPRQAGTSYAKGAAFVHNGAVYFARQAVVSAEHQQPGSTMMTTHLRMSYSLLEIFMICSFLGV